MKSRDAVAGVDRSLLRANLARSPTERVENLMALQRLAAEARKSRQRAAGRPKDLEAIAELEALAEELDSPSE